MDNMFCICNGNRNFVGVCINIFFAVFFNEHPERIFWCVQQVGIREIKVGNGIVVKTLCSECHLVEVVKEIAFFLLFYFALEKVKVLAVDALFLNEDRHTHNLAVLMDGKGNYKLAPIFDNGKSFLIGNQCAKNFNTLEEKITTAYAKAFSPSFKTNYKYLKKNCTLKINSEAIKKLTAPEYKNIYEILSITLSQ